MMKVLGVCYAMCLFYEIICNINIANSLWKQPKRWAFTKAEGIHYSLSF